MIIRKTGSGWLLSRLDEEPCQVASITELIQSAATLPVAEPIGLLWPCVAEIITTPWVQITPDLLDLIEQQAASMPIHLRSIPADVRKILAAEPSHPLWLGNDSLLFKSMPAAARRYALPPELGGEHLLRFGTDGLAHAWALAHQPDAQKGKTISIHLGDQTSLTAFKDGFALETSTGFSGLEGAGGSTAGGQLDPGVVLKLAEQIKNPVDLDQFLRTNCGWNGFLGRSVTLVDLLSIQDLNLARCQAIFETQLVREIGALAAVLGGPDRLLFFGQNHPAITGWLPSFLNKFPLLANIPHDWLNYADWLLEESIPAGPQNSANPSA